VSAAVQMGEYDSEPIRGLPERPPQGEEILWQGSPSWRSLALRAFHARKAAIYFAVLAVWNFAASTVDGQPFPKTAQMTMLIAAAAVATVGLLAGLAWLNCRATVYTITSRRIVIRFGVAISVAVNLPFRTIQSADVRVFADGTGDIPIEATGAEGLGYLTMWPFARAWKFGAQCRPMLRAVPDAKKVAEMLGAALIESNEPEAVESVSDPLAVAVGA
jgi:hypothetical protein